MKEEARDIHVHELEAGDLLVISYPLSEIWLILELDIDRRAARIYRQRSTVPSQRDRRQVSVEALSFFPPATDWLRVISGVLIKRNMAFEAVVMWPA